VALLVDIGSDPLAGAAPPESDNNLLGVEVGDDHLVLGDEAVQGALRGDFEFGHLFFN
jgi:hypothetical protein